VETLPLTATDEEIFDFACRWTQFLVNEDYQTAFDMLRYVPRSYPYNQPGESHFSNASEMKACIMNYGADKPIAGEPIYKVTPIETAEGGPWHMDPQSQRDLIRHELNHLYPGQLGWLTWFLPLNGEWSDLQASLDMVEDDGRLAFVLTALRIP
jgi:hypothetical protein